MDTATVAFIGVALVIVIVPGPDMALVARNTLRHGRVAGLATVAGILTGITGWAIAGAVGVATLLATSATAFAIVKVAGACYLIGLGIATLRSRREALLGAERTGRASLPRRTLWFQGFLSAALNPKLGVFFVTLLPQFVAPSDPPVLRSVELAVLFALIGLGWLVLFTELLSRLGSLFDRPAPQRAMRLVSGSVLVGLGLRLGLAKD